MKLSLGPLLYHWSRDQILEFYKDVANWPVDCVYLGETICSKRRSLDFEDWLTIAETLTATGKETVLSTLCLLEAESELLTLRKICANGRFAVEANDLGAVQILSSQGIKFVTGPTVNIYNSRTLAMLSRQGLKRWVLPVELSSATLIAMQAQRPAGIETEVLAFGKLPLAFSARCFTARSHNLPKDNCQYCCIDYPEGRLLSTKDNTAFLVLNGIQTMSARPINLLPELASLKKIGVDILRISPQPHNTQKIIQLFADCLHRDENPKVAVQELTKLLPLGECDGYWHSLPGMDKSKVGW